MALSKLLGKYLCSKNEKKNMLLTFISCFQGFETVVAGTRIKDIEPVIDLLNEIGKSLHFEIIREESIDCLGCRKGQ